MLCFAVVGILLAIITDITPSIFVAAALLFLITAFFDNRILLLALSALFGLNASLQRPLVVQSQGRELGFSGVVVSEDHQENGVKLSIDLKQALLTRDTISLSLPVVLYTRSRETFIGKSLLLRGKIKPCHSLDGRNSFTGRIVGEAKSMIYPMGKVLFAVRNHIDGLFQRIFTRHIYNLASGLVLGGSSRVGPELQAVFTRAGVLHILSVSGLHVGFLISFVSIFLLFLPMPIRIKFLITILVLSLYAGITGFVPTVLRAGLMGLLFGLAFIHERNVASIHIVNVSALLLITLSPRIIFDIGAQLSYASIYGIIYLSPLLKILVIDRIRYRSLKSLASLMAISIAAQLFVTPLLVLYFRRLQTLAVFSNLLVVPLSSVITYLLFGMIIAGLFCYPLARMIGMAATGLLNLLIAISRFFSGLPGAAPTLVLPFPFLILFYFLFIPRLRKYGVWGIVITGILLTLSMLPGVSELRLSKNEAHLVLPDHTRLLVTDLKNPDQLNAEDLAISDYLIAPVEFAPSRKGYYDLPKDLNYKQFRAGEWTIDARREITMLYYGRIWNLDHTVTNSKELLYVVAHERRVFQFKSKKYDSFLNQFAIELKLIYIKIRLLTV